MRREERGKIKEESGEIKVGELKIKVGMGKEKKPTDSGWNPLP